MKYERQLSEYILYNKTKKNYKCKVEPESDKVY